jgi:hypothetical protein
MIWKLDLFSASGEVGRHLLDPIERANLSHSVGISPLLRMDTDPVSETLCYVVLQNTRRWTKSKNPVIPIAIHHSQNPFGSSQ